MRSVLLLRQITSRSSRNIPKCIPINHLSGSFHHWQVDQTSIGLYRFFSSNVAEPSSLSEERKRFEDIDGIHPITLKALRGKGLETMTEIQEKTYHAAVNGQDVLGRARTGTGKTLAFLLPGLERLLRNPIPDQINMLILSPTRELAAQIAHQAQLLVKPHDKSITSQVIYGGSPKHDDIQRFQKRLPTILVATPGRLNDHLASTMVNGKPFVEKLQQMQVLVLDETDRLLDMGFRQDIQQIISRLPQKRQTLLFSATLPPEVQSMIEKTISPDYLTVDCIQDEDPTSHTNDMTEQSMVLLPPARFLTATVEVLLDLVDNPSNKTMCFFPTTSLVQLYANLFSHRLGRRVSELHGKMHQRSRTTISQQFRKSKSGTLFTSDVSARGVDYPDVTHVVQVGAAETRETYIHRLGRTGRAGKKGKGLLLLPEIEKHFLGDLKGLDIGVNSKWQAKLMAPPSKQVMDELGPIAQDVRQGRDLKLVKTATDAYQAMIGYYFQRANRRREDDSKIVETINNLVQEIGMTELPSLDSRRAQKLGIEDVPGLNIKHSWNERGGWADGWGGQSSSQDDDGGSRRSGGGGGGDGSARKGRMGRVGGDWKLRGSGSDIGSVGVFLGDERASGSSSGNRKWEPDKFGIASKKPADRLDKDNYSFAATTSTGYNGGRHDSKKRVESGRSGFSSRKSAGGFDKGKGSFAATTSTGNSGGRRDSKKKVSFKRFDFPGEWSSKPGLGSE
jgi:ATP-dependent RNA helicase MSS116